MSYLFNKINHQIAKAKPNSILSFNQKIAQFKDVIHLTLGEPDFNTPDHIKEAAINAVKDNDSHYSSARGKIQLRRNAAEFLKEKYNLNYDPETDIIATTGVSEGISTTLKVLINPNDDVIVPTPIFSIYTPHIEYNDANPVFLNTASDNFKVTPESLEETIKKDPEHMKAVILNYPNNPTGVTYSKEELEGLAKVIKKYDLFCISDEIYSELTYDKEHVSMGTILPENTIVLNGVSKSHAMTGYRIGIVAGPSDIVDKINTFHQVSTMAPSTISQDAASEAFKNGKNDGTEMKKAYQQRQSLLKDGLAKAGFDSPKPEGAFYLLAKIPDQFEQNSFKFAYQLAKEARVGTIPGAAFGPGGEGHLRISYAASSDDLRESVRRIQKFVDNHK